MRDELLIEHLRACTQRLTSGGEITGADLARAVEGLAQRELAEGGPYARIAGGKPDLAFNATAAHFLALQGVYLPKLDAYIEREMKRASSRAGAVADGAARYWAAGARHLRGRSEHALFVRRLARLPAPTRRIAAPGAAGESALEEGEVHILALIRREAARRFKNLPQEIARAAERVMERTIRGNPDRQMTLMAHYTRQALGAQGRRFSDKRIAQLGLANVFFWSAFIVYDDFWDEDEAADPRILPAANLFARHYSDFFATLLPGRTGFRAFFHEVMDALDGANAWEVAHCRMRAEGELRYLPKKLPAYGDFSIKFHPAAGHVLGPVALFVELGYSTRSREVRQLIRYFTHYLVAMQINDDAHDWKEDLARGHISTVVSMLLARWKKAHPGRSAIDIGADMPELERMFWFDTLVPACEMVLAHADTSRAALRAIECIADPAPLEKYIVRNERVARQALDERVRSIDFLNSIGRTS